MHVGWRRLLGDQSHLLMKMQVQLGVVHWEMTTRDAGGGVKSIIEQLQI